MFSARFVKVRDNVVPSSWVPSTVTVTVLKSKPGCPSTITSMMRVPVSTDGEGGVSGGGWGRSGSGAGIYSRRVKAYSNRSGLPASSRTPISSMRTWSTRMAVVISATNDTGSAARNLSRRVFSPSPASDPVSTPTREICVARRPRPWKKSPSRAGTPCWINI